MYSSSAMSYVFATSNGEDHKRLRERDTEEGHSAKKARTDSDRSILNYEEILAKLKSLSENLSNFASTHPQDQTFINGQVTQLTQIDHSLTHLFQNAQTYQPNTTYELLLQALNTKKFFDIVKYLNLLIQHNDLDRLIDQRLDLTEQQAFFDLSLEAAYQESSKKVFFALIQTIHRLQPSLLTAPGFISKMREIFDTEKWSDFKLTIQSKQNVSQIVTLHINKAYLGVIAPYFHQMFFGNHSWRETTQSELKLALEELQSSNDLPLTHENVYDVLRYCHTRTIYFRGAKECLAILLLAGKWQIQPLIKICDHYLAHSLDQLTDSFEAMWDIAKETQCTKLKQSLLHWALSQRLEGKQVDQNVLQILDKEKKQVKKLLLSLPLSQDQLNTIPTKFPQVEHILFNGLDKKKLNKQIAILQQLATLSKLKLTNMELHAKAIKAITSTQLSSLTSLSLINCTFKRATLNLPHTNAAQLREFKLTKSFTGKDFLFLKQCTNLESLTLHIEHPFHHKPFTENFKQLEKLKKLRLLHLDMRDASLFQDCQETLKKWTHLEQLELRSGGIQEFSDGTLEYPNGLDKANSAKIQSMIQKQNFPYLKIFKSNIAEHDISFLHTAIQLKSVTQLSLTTAIDAHQQPHPEQNFSFSPMPSLNTLEWNCGGIIPINRYRECSKKKHIPVLPFLAGLENIQNLYLKNAQLDDAILTQLKQFSHLYTLHCESIENVDDACLASLAQLPWLESLTLTQCDLITDQGLRSLLNSENLQKVIIQDCVNISEQGAALVKECQTIREFAFLPFQGKDWTFERAKNVLDTKPIHTQAMAYLLQAMFTTDGATIFHFATLAKEKLKQATERDPMQYIHWKNLGFVLHSLAKNVEETRHAYQQAARLGMDQAEFQEALQKVATDQSKNIRYLADLPR